jgi:hypothetical protein
VGEDEGAAILATDFKRVLFGSKEGVGVGGSLFCLFVVEVEDARSSDIGVVEIRRFLCGGTGVPSFSLSEYISTRPRGGGFFKAGLYIREHRYE